MRWHFFTDSWPFPLLISSLFPRYSPGTPAAESPGGAALAAPGPGGAAAAAGTEAERDMGAEGSGEPVKRR